MDNGIVFCKLFKVAITNKLFQNFHFHLNVRR